MNQRNFPVIDGKFAVQECEVMPNSHIVYIRKCVFCGEQHMHGAGCREWGPNVGMTDGIRHLGHRLNHCVQRPIEITLDDGTVISNQSGYFLGIGDQVPG